MEGNSAENYLRSHSYSSNVMVGFTVYISKYLILYTGPESYLSVVPTRVYFIQGTMNRTLPSLVLGTKYPHFLDDIAAGNMI